MKINKYTVNDGVKNIGPIDFQSILEMVASDKLKATDQLYLEESNQWILICQHPDFAAHFKPKPIPSPVGAELPSLPENSTWYILKGQDRQGPFAFLDVVKMLQQKIIFEYDYVWRQGMEAWARVAQVSDFAPNQIRNFMKTKEAKSQDIFFRRKFVRVPYKCEVVVHDNLNFWTGHTVELGEGGAGIVIQNALILPGQNIYLHFRPGQQTNSFNVLCEVVSKKLFGKGRDKNASAAYGMKFVNIPKAEKDLIRVLSAEAA